MQLRFYAQRMASAIEGRHSRGSGAPVWLHQYPIAWMIGHLAWQEQLYWLPRAQGKTVVPEVEKFGLSNE